MEQEWATVGSGGRQQLREEKHLGPGGKSIQRPDSQQDLRLEGRRGDCIAIGTSTWSP